MSLIMNMKNEITTSSAVEVIDYETLESVIHKWLLIEDPYLIKVLVGTVIANRLQGDPVWLLMVAAPGGAKTELIRGLNGVPEIYSLSDLTPQTLLSGYKDNKKASLLLRIPSGTILSLKDFTTVLSMHREARQAVLSQLREIYDGYVHKEFGTGESKRWEGKMGMIAGVTSIIDKYSSVTQTLGERFIMYRPKQPNQIKVALRAMSNSGGEKVMREEIQQAFSGFFAGIELPEQIPQVDESVKERIAHLASFCVAARSSVMRDGHATREIDFVPEVELPTRLSKVFIMLLKAFSLIDDDPEENYQLIYRIGMDTLPLQRKIALEALISAPGVSTVAKVAQTIGYPQNSTRRILEDLQAHGLVARFVGGNGRMDGWSLSDNAKFLLEKAFPAHESA